MSQDYWEARYQAQDMPWEKGAPSPGLVDFIASHPGLSRGAVCVPGCGTGHDVLEFARSGFDATGLDLAPTAIALARSRAQAAALKADFQLADFLRDEPHGNLTGFLNTRSFAPSNPLSVTIIFARSSAGLSREAAIWP